MTIDELKEKAEQYRIFLEKNSGKIIKSSKGGPISMNIIDDVIQVLESQQKTIDEIKEKLTKVKLEWESV
jgi:predicted transcriptional regulator